MELSFAKVSLHSLRSDMLSALVSKLEASSKLAKFQGTKDMLKVMSAAAAVYNQAKTKEDTKKTTSTSKDYFTILRNRYSALAGCVTAGLKGGVAAEQKAAKAIKEKMVSSSLIFSSKTEAMARLEKVLTALGTLPDETFETINALRYITDMQKNVAEYHSTMSKRVDVKVEKTNAAMKARVDLIHAVQNVTEAIKYAQRCLSGAENDLVKAYNTVFAEIATSIKLSSAHKKQEE